MRSLASTTYRKRPQLPIPNRPKPFTPMSSDEPSSAASNSPPSGTQSQKRWSPYPADSRSEPVQYNTALTMLFALGEINSALATFLQEIREDVYTPDEMRGGAERLHARFEAKWLQLPQSVTPPGCTLPYVLALQ